MLLVAAAGCAAIGYAVNDQVIPNGPYQVTSDSNVNHWEPATAVGPTWVQAFAETPNDVTFTSYTAAWNSGWTQSGPVNAFGSEPIGDVFLNYNSSTGQYVLSGTGFEATSSSAYFATSTDGLNWTNWQTVLSGPGLGGAFDYSSVAVDSTGRIAVGAVRYQNNTQTGQSWGYYVNLYQNGAWTGGQEVIAPPGPQVCCATADTGRWGINARIVSAGSQFYIFLPSLEQGQLFQPLAAWYYVENNGSWSGPNLVMDFSNNSPYNNAPAGQTPIYYAPLIDASGNASGTWAVTFQAKTGGGGLYNNVYQCNPSGCYAVNPYALNQFMNGVSVGPEGGIWVAYVGYSAPNSYQLPLYHQAIYFPPGGGAIGNTGDYDVDPTSWLPDTAAYRCNFQCYAMGDYARIGTNPYLAVDAPYVKFNSTRTLNELFQVFYSDPDTAPVPGAFTPKPVFYPLGTTLRGPSVANSPETLGVPPEKRRLLGKRN